jgi:hypothetical protein
MELAAALEQRLGGRDLGTCAERAEAEADVRIERVRVRRRPPHRLELPSAK